MNIVARIMEFVMKSDGDIFIDFRNRGMLEILANNKPPRLIQTDAPGLALLASEYDIKTHRPIIFMVPSSLHANAATKETFSFMTNLGYASFKVSPPQTIFSTKLRLSATADPETIDSTLWVHQSSGLT